MTKRQPREGTGNIGGPMTILDTEEQGRAADARHRRNRREACEIIIEENDPDNQTAVEGAKRTIAELDKLEGKGGV